MLTNSDPESPTMTNNSKSKPDDHWDRAAKEGYARTMYRNSDVETHVRGRLWRVAIEIADSLGVGRDACVLDIGCGDGDFANRTLAPNYRAVDGIDKSTAAIERARVRSRQNATFRAVDLVTFDFNSLPHYDAAFLIGILHHIKQATPKIVVDLKRRTKKLIVLEPNGNHLLRKALEFTPAYRTAGEDSFRTEELLGIFKAAGWRTAIYRRLNVFPNFTPGFVYRWLRPIEPKLEASGFWNALCTVDMYGLMLSNNVCQLC